MRTGKGKKEEAKTREVTGLDAEAAEADIGSAGNGADPFGADLTGGREDVEEHPTDRDVDIDHIEVEAAAEEEDEEEEEKISARPTEKPDVDLSQLP